MNKTCITFDIDWAPDFAIEKAANILIENNIKCTWFATHTSSYIEKLYMHKEIFELGIHPNFLPGSTHGRTEREVLKHICSVLPGARSVRTHGLYQSTNLLLMMKDEFGIETDCSLLLYLSGSIAPHYIYLNNNKKSILRIPFFWEDDIYMHDPQRSWDIKSPVFHTEGYKIYNFHPVHTFLNSSSTKIYDNLKSDKQIYAYGEKEFANHINSDLPGTWNFFLDLIHNIISNNLKTYTMSEIRSNYAGEQIN